MDKNPQQQRKNFRCVFSPYVTKDNREGVIRSIMSQFEGYEADPEVTEHGDGFTLSLMLGPELNATLARDKILWNRFVESVSAAEAIRKIQILRLPKAGLMDFGGDRLPGEGSVGGFGPQVNPMTGNTGVDEKLNIDLNRAPKYQIDGDPNDTLGHHASVRKYADPTDLGSEDQAFVHGLTPADLTSDANRLETGEQDQLATGRASLPKVLSSFKRIAIDTDAGSAFTLNEPNGFQSVNDAPRSGGLHEKATPATGIGGGAPISGASWFVTQPGNEQGTDLGTERNKNYDLSSSSAPLGGITAKFKRISMESPAESEAKRETEQEFGAEPNILSVGTTPNVANPYGHTASVLDGSEHDEEQGIKREYGSTLDMLGVGEHPLAGAAYGSLFGINETYDYQGDIDDYNL